MDGMPEHLFEQNEKETECSEQFEMINFKHKAQKRIGNKMSDVDTNSQGSLEIPDKKSEEGSYLSKLNNLA